MSIIIAVVIGSVVGCIVHQIVFGVAQNKKWVKEQIKKQKRIEADKVFWSSVMDEVAVSPTDIIRVPPEKFDIWFGRLQTQQRWICTDFDEPNFWLFGKVILKEAL